MFLSVRYSFVKSGNREASQKRTARPDTRRSLYKAHKAQEAVGFQESSRSLEISAHSDTRLRVARARKRVSECVRANKRE